MATKRVRIFGTFGYERRVPSNNNIDHDNDDNDNADDVPSNNADEDIDNGEDLAVEETVSVSRRIDIVAIPKNRSCIYLIDPTIRIESNEAAVKKALKDKQKTYKPPFAGSRNSFRGYQMFEFTAYGLALAALTTLVR